MLWLTAVTSPFHASRLTISCIAIIYQMKSNGSPILLFLTFLVIGEGDVPVVIVLVKLDVDGGFLSGAPGVGLVDPVT